nr:hypothetical protein [uncultured Bacteroides sp.]
MKALLLTFMFFISITAFSQQKYSKEDGGTVLIDSPIILNNSSAVASNDSLMSSHLVIVDHNALAKRYKRKSTNYGIAAVVFGVGVVGCSKYIYDHFSSHRAVNALAIGTVCLGATIGCAIASIVYHHKAGKQLKLSVKGTTASLVYTF